MSLSVLVALVLTPALCADDSQAAAAVGARGAQGLLQVVQHLVRPRPREARRAAGFHAGDAPGRSMLVYLGIVLAMGLLFTRIPSSFLPNEDPGFMYGQVQTPPGASKERTWEALDLAQKYLTEQEKDTVDGVLTVNGFNFAGTGQNSGLLFIKLKDWDERKKAEQQIGAPAGARQQVFLQHQDANIIAVPPPAVLELGNTAGFDMMLQNRGGLPREVFMAARNQLLGEAAKDPRLANVRPNGVEDAPQFKLDIDREKGQRARRLHRRTSTRPCRPAGRPPTSTISSIAAA
jgi:multidrug efflux pump